MLCQEGAEFFCTLHNRNGQAELELNQVDLRFLLKRERAAGPFYFEQEAAMPLMQAGVIRGALLDAVDVPPAIEGLEHPGVQPDDEVAVQLQDGQAAGLDVVLGGDGSLQAERAGANLSITTSLPATSQTWPASSATNRKGLLWVYSPRSRSTWETAGHWSKMDQTWLRM